MWEEEVDDFARRKVAWLIGIVVAVAIVIGGYFWWQHRAPPPAPAAPPPAPHAPAPATAPLIAHPIPGASAPGAAALPALNDSDQVVRDSLAGVLGRGPVARFLIPENIVRHIVATVDNLPRRKLAVELRPVKPTPGETVTSSQGEIISLSEKNFARYAPLVRVVQGTDVKALAVVYERLYPLFQEAYENLGYPGKYFNDRLVEVIDNLLQTPEVPGPIPLVQPKVFYEYADPDLENRSAGQKLLIRMGPQNARVIKAKLREFRGEIVKNK